MTSKPARNELKLNIDTAQWEWLRSHLERGGLLFVSPDLDLVEAGFGIASDDVPAVSEWIARRKITKPSAEQLFDWDAMPETSFRMLIISPYVLIQLLEPLSS